MLRCADRARRPVPPTHHRCPKLDKIDELADPPGDASVFRQTTRSCVPLARAGGQHERRSVPNRRDGLGRAAVNHDGEAIVVAAVVHIHRYLRACETRVDVHARATNIRPDPAARARRVRPTTRTPGAPRLPSARCSAGAWALRQWPGNPPALSVPPALWLPPVELLLPPVPVGTTCRLGTTRGCRPPVAEFPPVTTLPPAAEPASSKRPTCCRGTAHRA